MVKGNVSTQSPRVHSHRNFPSNTKGPSINYGPVHLIRPPSKTPFKAPFKAPFRHKTQTLEAYVVFKLVKERGVKNSQNYVNVVFGCPQYDISSFIYSFIFYISKYIWCIGNYAFKELLNQRVLTLLCRTCILKWYLNSPSENICSRWDSKISNKILK